MDVLRSQSTTRISSKDASFDNNNNHFRLVHSFMAGALSGSVSCLLFQPLDLIKTKMQTFVIPFDKSRPPLPFLRANGAINTVARVVTEEGFFNLWKGLTPSIYRQMPGVGMYFACLHQLKSGLSKEPTFYENLFLGAGARGFVGTVLLPVTVIKARFESGHFTYRSVPEAMSSIWRGEGIRGLFSGWVATVARDAPFSGIYLMFYSQEKKLTENYFENTILQHFVCGLSAGVFASLTTHPADVIKTQLQLYPSRYTGTLSCVKFIFLEYGVLGFIRGMGPRCLRRTLVSAMSWTVYEEFMNKLRLKV